MKECSKCGESKALDQFHRSSSRKDGLYPQCKKCANDAKASAREKMSPEDKARWRGQTKLWKQANPDKVKSQDKKQSLRRKFGITPEQYQEMLDNQGGVCAICGEKPNARKLAVDHCHRTNAVRALLCSNCNTALGLMKDNADNLRKGAEYIEIFRDSGACG